MGNNVCYDFYSSYPISRYLPGVSGNVGIGGIVIGFVYFLSSAITISWIRTQQQNALRGMEGAAKHVIFPIYLPIMWVSALSDAFRGLVIFFVKTNASGATSWENSIIIASAFGIQHFVIEGIAVILIQYGCGMRAIRVASIGGGAVGLFTFLTALFLYRDGGSTPASSIIYVCWLFTLTIFYAILWLVPQEKLYRRPAAIFYAKFWTLLTGLVLIADGVGLLGPGVMPEATNISTCVYNVVALPILVLFKPFVMYTTLLMESKWWQGLLIRPPGESHDTNSLFDQILCPITFHLLCTAMMRQLYVSFYSILPTLSTFTEHARASTGRGSGHSAHSGHRGKMIPNRPDRFIRSIDQALDMLANETNRY